MEKSHIIIVLLIIIIIIFVMNMYNKKENITTDSGKTLSDEALQNIASVYNNKNLTVTNLTVTAWKGIICAWSGAITDIPQGWGFCDGTLYNALDGSKLQSPDLRGRFIVSAGQGTNLTNRNVGDKGGEETHTLTIAEIPAHAHTYSAMRNDNGNEYHNGSLIGYSNPNWWSLKANTDPTGVTGGNSSHNNMPPYYALAYIIKL